MGIVQTVLIVLITWLILAVPLAIITAMLVIKMGKQDKSTKLPEVQTQYIDTIIDDVLDSKEGADDWLDHKKMVIAEVFANGETWCDHLGNIVKKDDPSVAAHITFNVIRAAMMKFYAAGILDMQQEGEK